MADRIVVDPQDPSSDSLHRAAELLRSGQIVAFPTETVYGLGADALNADAVRRVFVAKGRPATHPLIVHVASTDRAALDRVVAQWPPLAQRLADAFWPGPLTLILPVAQDVPSVVTGGLRTVGVRLPAHPVARALVEAAGTPLAAPSANRYTGVSPTTAEHVLSGLGDRIELVLDAGPTPVGIESTVLDLTASSPRILRPGAVTATDIREIAGEVDRAEASVADHEPRASPGLASRHYAPRARVRPLEARSAEDAGPTGAIVIHERPGTDHVIRLRDDPGGYSRDLYAALHEMDARGVRTLYVEAVPAGEDWDAARDRLARAGAAPD